eukprot:CAMPEP_0119045984 /NCGR_PEP_ID=MMETSP1177-20130426/43704_1 /TAXON_ID=2985 /ORGANISM="Ochromonas sp, Strain CCMP1899" /LENGTH=52 /DNA_ID=CAMNT_0007018519 /DNA_START=117 /DNA_END=272 /DNA_ORIENTATION=+
MDAIDVAFRVLSGDEDQRDSHPSARPSRRGRERLRRNIERAQRGDNTREGSA